MKNDAKNKQIVNCAKLPASRCVESQIPSSEIFLHAHSFPPTSSLWSVDLVKHNRALPNVVSDSPDTSVIEFLWIARAFSRSLFNLKLHAFFALASICTVAAINSFCKNLLLSQYLRGNRIWTRFFSSTRSSSIPPVNVSQYSSWLVTGCKIQKRVVVNLFVNAETLKKHCKKDSNLLTGTVFCRWHDDSILCRFYFKFF